MGCKQDNMNHTHVFFYYFCDCFLGNIPRIFLEYSWKSFQKNLSKVYTILLNFMLKNMQKMSFSKKFKSFYYLKANVTMFNEFFC
jgi:hypothetical protein